MSGVGVSQTTGTSQQTDEAERTTETPCQRKYCKHARHLHSSRKSVVDLTKYALADRGSHDEKSLLLGGNQPT